MFFIDKQQRAADHQDCGDDEQERWKFPKDNNGQQHTRQRSRAIQRAGARRAQSAHGADEQHRAQAVADKSQKQCVENGCHRRKCIAKKQRKKERERARDQSLPCHDGKRIFARDIAREIIVHAPEHAGKDNSQRAERESKSAFEIGREENACQRDDQNRSPRAAADGFLEKQQGDQGCPHAFKIQQQRSRGRGCILQTDHQNDRRKDSARDDRARQPFDIWQFDVRFGILCPHPLSQPDEESPCAAAEIQKRRKEDRRDIITQ